MRPAHLSIPLVGPGGEPVNLARTLHSHGIASLPPMRLDGISGHAELTVAIPRGRPRTLELAPVERDEGGTPHVAVRVRGGRPTPGVLGHVEQAVRTVLALDHDLSGFYERVAADPELAWVATGAGRMARGQTALEDVVKTVCTTNCAWSATERMVGAIVGHLGVPAAGPGPERRAFPTAAALATAGRDFYTAVARAGYRAASLSRLAELVADGTADLEAWRSASPDELSDDDLSTLLQSLPGIGPYAAAHLLLVWGRGSRLVLDSWTRPTYAALAGRETADADITRRFAPYGQWAGLAFWLLLTRGWVPEPPPSPT